MWLLGLGGPVNASTPVARDTAGRPLVLVHPKTGIQLAVIGERVCPQIKLLLPGEPLTNPGIEVEFPEAICATDAKTKKHEILYVIKRRYKPGQIELPAHAWKRDTDRLSYRMRFDSDIEMLAEVILDEDGVRFHYELTNHGELAWSRVQPMTCVRLRDHESFADERLDRTWVHCDVGWELLASDRPDRHSLPLEDWRASRYQACFQPPPTRREVRHEHSALREGDFTRYYKDRQLDASMMATVSVDGEWIVATASASKVDVWTHTEWTSHHSDPVVMDLPPGTTGNVDLKTFLLRGTRDELWKQYSAAYGEPEKATTTTLAQIAKTPDEVPFISGALWVPELFSNNNNKFFAKRQATVDGLTHLEVYLLWRYMEKKPGEWDLESMEKAAGYAREHGFKIEVYPWVQFAPDWFKETSDYVQLCNAETGGTVDLLSPWAPGTRKAMEHFYSMLAEKCREHIDIISVGSPTSDFAEIGLVIGAPAFVGPTRGPSMHTYFPQDPEHWKAGLWCGDPYARSDFREWALGRYGSVDEINRVWGTAFETTEQITYPDRASRLSQRRYWLDFMRWYHDSQTEFSEWMVALARRHFPGIMLETKLGFGCDNPLYALDRTDVSRRLARFAPFTVRSTHAGVNRMTYGRAYWFYKRMAPVARAYGAGFGSEPPGGDMKAPELKMQRFEDASVGVNYFFQWQQNWFVHDRVVAEFKEVLRPHEASQVEVGILYPTSQLWLDMDEFPQQQTEFCFVARDQFDYDVVDENMISWGMLPDYKVLVHTGGRIFEAGTLAAIERWVRNGGVLVLRDGHRVESVEGADRLYKNLGLDDLDRTSGDGPRVAAIGKGAVAIVNGPGSTTPAELSAWTARVCSGIEAAHELQPGVGPIAGYVGKSDGKWETEFPSGTLIYDTKSRETLFTERATGLE